MTRTSDLLVVPEHLRSRWDFFLGLHADDRRTDYDPWRVHPIVQGHPVGDDWPSGPAVYAVFGDGAWRHVGQTRDSVAKRIRRHFTSAAPRTRSVKLATWEAFVLAEFPPSVSGRDLDALEREAGLLLKPSGGGTAGRYPLNRTGRR